MTKQLIAIMAGVLALGLAVPMPVRAQDAEEFHKAFNELLHKAIEDAVRGWENGDGKSELEEMADMLEKLLQGQGDGKDQLSDEDLEKWLGEGWLEKLGEGGGAELDLEVDPKELNQLAQFLAKMAGIAEPGDFEKEHKAVLDEYVPVVADARKSTARVLAGGRQVSLATVVHENGYLLTKLSEVRNLRDLECGFSDGFKIGAKRVDQFPNYDLAMLKVDAKGLRPVEWANGKPLETGTFLAAVGTGEVPVAIGVASVASRDLSGADRGFLGVELRPADDEGNGVVVGRVFPDSPAAEAGLRVGDEVLELDGDKIGTVPEFVDAIGGRKPGKEIGIKIRRDGEAKALKAKLGDRSGPDAQRLDRLDFFNQMGGPLSANRNGYPKAVQTDLTLKPNECGGPLVDLDGRAVGINIARSGRVKSYAIPAAELKRLLGEASEGKFSVVDTKSLEFELEKAADALEALEAGVRSARKRKDDLEAELQKARENAKQKAEKKEKEKKKKEQE